MPMLEAALDASAFLVRGELLLVRNVRPIETAAGPVWGVTVERAMGDHPDWDIDERVIEQVVYEDRFYLQLDRAAPLSLDPFVLARSCSLCGQRHVYYPDKVRDGKVVLLSMDRGHEREDSDDALLGAVSEAIGID
jgi:hypothetical protein